MGSISEVIWCFPSSNKIQHFEILHLESLWNKPNKQQKCSSAHFFSKESSNSFLDQLKSSPKLSFWRYSCKVASSTRRASKSDMRRQHLGKAITENTLWNLSILLNKIISLKFLWRREPFKNHTFGKVERRHSSKVTTVSLKLPIRMCVCVVSSLS